MKIIISTERSEAREYGCTGCEVHVYSPEGRELDGGPLNAVLTNFEEQPCRYPEGSYIRPVGRKS